ncbi:SusC/RagA family TonB-linked outer membrane protein [Sphingobacterium sp. LRF_L2]|uniref:SusC/RagA family TonB-linked outer membrane protein n=1 Tax=Sphingobacterium sp. LRF_L2 TaxID=3369421 RepID=UPI003F5DC4F1
MRENLSTVYGVSVHAVFCLFCLFFSQPSQATPYMEARGVSRLIEQDTVERPSSDSTVINSEKEESFSRIHKPIRDIALYGNATLHQFLKGEAAGLYVSESTGEPGTPQSMFIRGITTPVFSHKDVYANQPLIILDGIPLIRSHPFSYTIQAYNVEQIGPENNLLSNFDIDNLASIEVLKDMSEIAIYGPLAANGVIRLTTKANASNNKRRISLNSFVGMSQRPQVTTINGEFENNFRKQFYDLYTSNGQYGEDDIYPVYLSDSLNNRYYGPSNWSDSYYNNALNYGINAQISGGGPRSNFQFSLGNLQQGGIADDTKFKKYSARFQLDIQPLKWLTFHTMINGTRLDRKRNKNLRNRFAMMSYFPDLSAPLAPNREAYDAYLKEYDKSFDNNFTNILEGNLAFDIHVGGFKFRSSLAVDYNEGFRDLFYPSTLLESNNFASNYYGYNQRLLYDNSAQYKWDINEKQTLLFEVGNVLQWDTHKYNYAYAYKGLNDFIKLNLLESDPNKDNYLNPTAFPRQLVFKFLDRTRHNLVSFYGQANYRLKEKYSASLLLRYDGSSNAQPTSRWIFTPALNLGWNLKEEFFAQQSSLQMFKLRAGAGRLGIVNTFDNISQGPNYTAQIGYTGNVIVPGYNGFAGLVRPYQDGWVGYNIPWAYTDQANLGIDIQMTKRNIYFSVDAYIKQNKNQVLTMPGFAEYGYKFSLESGMDVQNTGVDLSFGGDAINEEGGKFKWNTGFTLSFNNNKLTRLPRGLDEVVIEDRLLKVGERIDAFWIYENKGIYTSDAEVPTVDGVKLNYNGIAFKAGDPIWVDQNSDNRISSEDRVLKGNYIPKLSGSWQNNFTYGAFDLKLNFYFNLGRHIINQEMANRFDFVNNENAENINAIKEITFWEKRGDYSKYPLYNPWSSVAPYQYTQDLFMEDGSFLKLRQASLGYDFSNLLADKLKGGRLYVYCAANNLFTASSYSGRDPELVNYLGLDNGYQMILPRSYILGFKMDF